MADELSQSGFDKTIESLKKDLVKAQKATSEKVEGAIIASSVPLENMIEQTTRSLIAASQKSTEMLQQTMISQFMMNRQIQVQSEEENSDTLLGLLGVATAAAEQAKTADKDEAETEKKSIFLFTNMKNAMSALVNVSTVNKLSETERAREEKRASDALLGVLGELGTKFDNFKGKLKDLLGLATNPLALIGSILGVVAGAVAGFFVRAKQLAGIIRLGTLLTKMFAPLTALFGPTTKLGKAVRFVAGLFKPFGSFITVIGNLIKAFIKGSGTFSKIFRFMKPFIKFGSALLGKFFIPLTVIISIFKGVIGFMDEIKKGGDIFEASLRAIGDILEFLTFGLIDADALKEFFGKPMREFVEGIKELFIEGFSLKTLKKVALSFIKIFFSIQTIIIKSLGKLVAFVLDKLGFEKTAEVIRTFFAKFNLGEMMANIFDPIIDVFAVIAKGLFNAGSFIVKINVAVAKFFIDIFKGAKDFILGSATFVKEVGVAISSMFTDIIDAVFEFVVGAISKIPLLNKAIPQELKDSIERNKEIRAIKKELGKITLEEAEAELVRRKDQQSKLEGLKKDQEVVAKILADPSLTGAQRAAHRENLVALQSDIDAIKNATKLQAGGIVTARTLARVAETEAEAVIPLSKLGELIVNPAIASALMMAEQLATNSGLRNQGIAPTVVAPITNIGSVGGGGGGPSIIPLPLALRNTDDNLQRIMMKDFRGALT